MSQRQKLVDNQHKLSVRKQSDLLSIHRSGLYFVPILIFSTETIMQPFFVLQAFWFLSCGVCSENKRSSYYMITQRKI
jgi:hypothetical protein